MKKKRKRRGKKERESLIFLSCLLLLPLLLKSPSQVVAHLPLLQGKKEGRRELIQRLSHSPTFSIEQKPQSGEEESNRKKQSERKS